LAGRNYPIITWHSYSYASLCYANFARPNSCYESSNYHTGGHVIQKLEINGVHTVVDEDLQKYVTKKIGKLDQYMSRHARESAHAEVTLKEVKAKDKKQCICEVVIYLPHGVITTKESTVNMYAAVDIVETKLKNQLRKYKEKHEFGRIRKRVSARLHREEQV
jgi:ribosomal subunit interface protein